MPSASSPVAGWASERLNFATGQDGGDLRGPRKPPGAIRIAAKESSKTLDTGTASGNREQEPAADGRIPRDERSRAFRRGSGCRSNVPPQGNFRATRASSVDLRPSAEKESTSAARFTATAGFFAGRAPVSGITTSCDRRQASPAWIARGRLSLRGHSGLLVGMRDSQHRRFVEVPGHDLHADGQPSREFCRKESRSPGCPPGWRSR